MYTKLIALILLIPGLVGFLVLQSQAVFSQATRQNRGDRFRHNGVIEDEDRSAIGDPRSDATEAPTGFDNLTNGFTEQGPSFETLNEDNIIALRSFNDNRFIFEEVEKLQDGLGPTYNAQSCRECHQNVVTGGASQVAELRSGRSENGQFFESLGGTLIHSRATHPDIVEQITPEDSIRTFRISTNTLGNGFVEAIANSTLLAIRDKQPVEMRGTAVMVPVLEAASQARIGRFGWKGQHASLESFSADAYLNEMGVTTPLFPDENTSNGRFVGYGSGYDPVADPEDDGVDVVAFADFMRSTKAPPRGPISVDVVAGGALFDKIGCAVCHTPSITTARPGTKINGGVFTVPAALGNKIIHPYSDYLLHDIAVRMDDFVAERGNKIIHPYSDVVQQVIAVRMDDFVAERGRDREYTAVDFRPRARRGDGRRVANSAANLVKQRSACNHINRNWSPRRGLGGAHKVGEGDNIHTIVFGVSNWIIPRTVSDKAAIGGVLVRKQRRGDTHFIEVGVS